MCLRLCYDLFAGLIVGAIIRYTSYGSPKPSAYVTLGLNSSYDSNNLPNSLRLAVESNVTGMHYYQYVYTHPINRKEFGDQELEEKVRNAALFSLK